MGKTGKSLSLILVLILVIIPCASLLMVKTATAQSIPKPSIPEFRVRLVAYPYDVPPTYGIDQYTGKSVIIKEGEHVENKSIEIVIRNQPFTTYTNEKGNVIRLCYNFTFKGHYGNDWTTYKDPHFSGYVNGTNSEYTIVSIPLLSYELGNVREGGELDFKVEALIGYQEASEVMTPLGNGFTYSFSGESSGWSNIRTISIPDGSVSYSTPNPSPSVSPSPTVPEITSIALALLILVSLFATVLIKIKGKNN